MISKNLGDTCWSHTLELDKKDLNPVSDLK